MILTDYNGSRDDCRKNSRKISFELYELETVLHEDETEKFVPATVFEFWERESFIVVEDEEYEGEDEKEIIFLPKLVESEIPDLGKAKLKIPFF